MLVVGQQLGPFVIDKELGSGAMGTVYRARYTKTGQVVALKVMAPGLGTTNASAGGRFEREAEILKQLKHDNIVRIFGVGKSQGIRYYAMEYIQGESLDRVMARRDRMTWEELVELGKQLCSALQHAHEQGIVHRDLKPSNLMILRDGTLKLTDFGIAKDLDETGLTSTNCTVGTAAYMSPEQCRGERNLTYKSDLYSLGIVFYELITGRKPFLADNAMEMFLKHVQDEFERPSRLVPDLPVWLDTLICQLMEKKPEHRPLDAAMVSNTLDTIQEKVEAQQSAGVDAARARMMDRPRDQRHPDEEDKEAARILLTGKGRPRRKSKKKRWHQRVWVKAVGIAAALALVVGLLVLALKPPSAQTMFKRAERAWNSKQEDAHYNARFGPIKEYLDRYGHLDDDNTRKVREWAETYDVGELEKKLARHRNKHRTGRGLAVEARNDADKKAFRAAVHEDDGEKDEALQLWNKLKGDPDWGALAARHIADLDNIRKRDGQFDTYFKTLDQFGKEEPLEGRAKEAFVGLRYEQFGDLIRARKCFEVMKDSAGEEMAENQAERLWYLYASGKVKDLKDPQGRKGVRKNEERKEWVVAKLQAAEASGSPLKARRTCLDVVALYGKDEDLQEEIAQARELLAKIKKQQGER
jgi:serine/threonine-protein kinase